MYQNTTAEETQKAFEGLLNGTFVSGELAEQTWPTWRPIMVIVDLQTMEVLLMDLDDGTYDVEDYIETIQFADGH